RHCSWHGLREYGGWEAGLTGRIRDGVRYDAHAIIIVEPSTLAALGLFHDLLSEADFFFRDALAHFEASEADHFTAGSLDELGDALVRVLDEGLLGQAVLGQELLQAATDHLLGDILGLAGHVRLRQDDRLLGVELLLRHVLG